MPPEDDPLQRGAAELVGRVLCGKWRLDGLLGVGGMAAVYSATHRNGKRVAVKVLHKIFATLDEVKSRFLSEGYAANAVQHPGVVSVLDDDVTDEGCPFLVMDLLEGETVDARLVRYGTLSLEETCATAAGVLEVLAAAHAVGIVHRDIKPGNVFRTASAQIKLLDFGIARVRELSPHSNMTEVGSTMGTPAYMPPEQARGRWDEVDARSDVWALGALMFTLLSGHHVHEGETTNEVLLSAMTRPPPSLATVCPWAPPLVIAIVDRALAFNKEARWQDASQMLTALQHASHPGIAAALAQPAQYLAPRTYPPGPLPPPPGPTGLDAALSIPANFGASRSRTFLMMGGIALTAALGLSVAITIGARRSGAVPSSPPPVAAAVSAPSEELDPIEPATPAASQEAPAPAPSPSVAKAAPARNDRHGAAPTKHGSQSGSSSGSSGGQDTTQPAKPPSPPPAATVDPLGPRQ